MYIQKKPERGYTEYVSADVRDGEKSYMDAGILIMEDGDTFSVKEDRKEVAVHMMLGDAELSWSGGEKRIERENPFDYNPWCLHLPAGEGAAITARGHSEFYIQKTYNDRRFPAHLYTPDETDTWRRGGNGECGGCIERDVRTCFDYESAPWSNMVLGEVVNLPGKWSSYPPHHHPQPEIYCFFFERPEGFGAGWVDGKVEELHHHGMAVITKGNHPMVMAPGYPCCYTWGIRHLPGNPWEKTRIDDPAHIWMVQPGAKYWDGKKK